MKCSNPDCKRGIGLVVYRRGWFSNRRRYCSKHCRDAFVADAPKLQQEGSVTTYFERLFLQIELSTSDSRSAPPPLLGKPRSSRSNYLT